MLANTRNSRVARARDTISILALLTAMVGSGLLSPAFGAVAAESAESAESAAAEAGSARDDIVVTARNPEYRTPDTSALKLDAPLRDVPQTIDVIPDQVIRDQRALSMQDAVKNVAGIGMATGDGQRDQFVIRGHIAYGDLFIDGVRDDALYFRDLSNIERIEILKGPASVLYGRGSSGGLINRVSKKPGTQGGEIVLSYGSWDGKRGEIDLGHVVSSNLAVRLTGAIERSDSYRDQGFLNREAIAPSVLFAPSDRTRILLQADYLRDRRVTDNGIPAFRGRPVEVPASTYYGAANARDVDFSQSEVWSTTATLDHEFSDTLKLHNAFRYYDYTLDRQNTIPNVVNEAARTVTLNRQSTDRAEHGWFNQLELSGTFSTGALEHKLLVGFEVGRQSKYERRVDQTNRATVDLFNPVLPVLPLEVAGNPSTHRTGVYKTLGFYAQDMISLGEHWKVLAGLRYDRFRQEVRQRIAGQADLARTDTFWSPRVGLVWQPSPTQSYYVSWNKSYQPSGETFALSASNADLAPENTINREIGAKFDLFDGRLSTTISAFDLTRSDIKAADPTLNRVVRVGVQRTRGVELSAQLELSQGWQAIASYAYLDARITKSPALDSGVPIQGNRPTLTPVNSASLWVMRNFGDSFGLGGGVNYVGDRQANLANTVVLPQYVTADAMAWARLGKLKAQLNIRNIFDRGYIVSAHGTVGNLNMPGAPRSAMFTLRYAID